MNNYRPICILPFLSKVIEKLICTRLTNYLNKFNILSPCQFGFRSGYSSDLALISLTDQLKKAIDNGYYAGGVFIDLTKAFDSINHHILFNKLEAFGITGPTLLLLRSYLCNRTQKVVISNAYSSTKLTNIGVPQGSILGPLLFLLYINDLPKSLSSSSCILYADDTTIFNSDSSITSLTGKLNFDLAQLVRWCSNNMLEINTSKTKFVVFSSPQKPLPSIPPVIIARNDIPVSDCCRFLGVELDSNLKYHRHVAYIRKKMTYGIRLLIKSRLYFNPSILMSLYFSFVHSHISYCITSWGNTYTTHLTSVQTIQNQAIRILTSSPYLSNAKSLLHENNILTVSELVKYNLGIYMYRTINNQLPHFTTILSNNNVTRFALNNNFLLPKVRTNYGKQTIHFSGISFWNSLPSDIKVCRSLKVIKSKLKNHIMSTN